LVALNASGCVAFSDTLSAVYCAPFLQPVISENNGSLLVSNVAQNATFSWFLDGQLLSNTTNNILNYNQNGHYQCIITDAFGCSDSTQILLIDAGLAANKSANPSIYPNPAKDIINIALPTHWLGSLIELIDLNGKVLYSEKANAKALVLHLSSIPSGLYVLSCTNQIDQFRQLIFVSTSD
jgi:hypothetical protein